MKTKSVTNQVYCCEVCTYESPNSTMFNTCLVCTKNYCVLNCKSDLYFIYNQNVCSICKSDNSFFFIFIPVMVMMLLIVNLSSISNNNEDSLLTDEQKLAKQKVMALEKEKEFIKKQEEAKWWDDQITYVLNEKPLPIVGIGGMIIFLTLIKTSQMKSEFGMIFGGRWRWLNWLNMPSIIVIFTGMIYLAWLAGYVNLTGAEI